LQALGKPSFSPILLKINFYYICKNHNKKFLEACFVLEGHALMRKKLRLILCILGWHKKKLYVGGYRCEFCGKYVKGYKPK
jgi:hypothetical protein